MLVCSSAPGGWDTVRPPRKMPSTGVFSAENMTRNGEAEEAEDVEKLLEMIEEDDDVQNVYHSMQE